MSAADWFVGKVGEPKPKRQVKLAAPADVTPAQLDDVERLLDRAADEGKKLAAGITAGMSAMERLASCGLTPDALVLLVTAKCRWAKNGKKVSPETVEIVLEALFRLGEHLR